MISKSLTFGSLLLLSTALVSPQAFAQTSGTASSAPAGPRPAPAGPTPTSPAEESEAVDISAPGARDDNVIVVTGRNIPQPIRATPEVISVLSTAEIARTGEGDIAGALQRVTGLSVVGGRFVYVRGLGERYSLALLNGSPLPSPEPLRRVIPLDLFPTNLLASTVVQKSYSVNYPGEFGGGVINLTTRSVPDKPFFSIGVGIEADTETTGELGYTYYGSDTDWTGFDDGTRDIPGPLKAAIASGKLLNTSNFTIDEVKQITASLVNASTNVIQRNRNIPANFSANISGGTSFDMGEATLGVIASAGFKNGWQTRGGLQQVSGGSKPSEDGPILEPDRDFRFLSTENRIVVNGLLGLSAEFDRHKLRWTNLYIRDTLKEARIQSGVDNINDAGLVNRNFTSWFERQLIDTQGVAEFDFGALNVDLRGTYANSQRESPYERVNSYRFDEEIGDYFNALGTGGTSSRIAFSDLNDDVYGASIDLSYKLPTANEITLSSGYTYYKNERSSTRLDFDYQAQNGLPGAVQQQRPDYLLSDYNVYSYNILLTGTSAGLGVAAYDAGLRVHAGYGQVEAEIMPMLRATAGVRYESGRQFVTPLDLFGGGENAAPTLIERDYWLPAATITWNFYEDMQLRLAASKTIARPQFRELALQQYQDPESDRTFFGNPFLVDSELFNLEARYEYYFGREQRVSLAGFYKSIDKPIETVAFQQGGSLFTTFANAPKATLYGAELELVKYFPLDTLGAGPFLESRRVLLSANYTYSKSKIEVGEGDTTIPSDTAGVPVPATDIFEDGTPLSGQSKHIANLQFGLENTDRLSQQTLLLTYSSRRVTNRGPGGQPDLIEEPGLRLDFVAREGITLAGTDLELKFELRNITGENYEEYQTLGNSRVDTNSYDLGRTVALSVSAQF